MWKKVGFDAYLCVCGCVLWAATVWRRPCRRLDIHRVEYVSECASLGLPGWCTPWDSVCSGRPGVQGLQREEKVSAAVEHSVRAGGGTVLRGWCNCYCSADSGRYAGWCLGWEDLKYDHHPLLPHCRCCWRENCWGPEGPVVKGTETLGWSGKEVRAGCRRYWRMDWWGSRSGQSCCWKLEARPVESFLGQKLETQKKGSQVHCHLNGQII